VAITINTDDPAMMEIDLGEEFRRVAATFLDPVDQAALAADLRNRIERQRGADRAAG
jgi:adenosine deaminase